MSIRTRMHAQDVPTPRERTPHGVPPARTLTPRRVGPVTILVLGLVLLGAGAFRGMSAAAPADEALAPDPVAAAPTDAVRYDRDIRPILSDRCFRCHGRDPSTRAAELRLDERDRATAKRDGRPAIVPGNVDESELWRRVTSSDPDYRMPPPDSNKRALSAEERELFRRWIESGAEYEPHWAFVPPVRPEVPASADERDGHPVDRLVGARLKKAGLTLSDEADRASLLRRLFIDLTGLPPTPEELDAFTGDAAPDAYERWVDRLLNEEPYRTRYAERMAVPWLDAARYADTCGIHTDAGRQIWPWRDWVLGAYRDNMPFDRFLAEQIAGDLLPNATDDQKVASGFLRNHVTTDEGGAIAAEYLVEYAVERTSTVGSVFLGLTLGCARCHEHKFDPISQEEFYRLYAFFNSIEEPGLYSQLPDANRAFEPLLVVPSAEQQAQRTALEAEVEASRARLEESTPEEQQQRSAFFRDLPERTGLRWAASEVLGVQSTAGATLTPQPDGSVLASGDNPDKDEHIIRLRTAQTGLRLLALEALGDPSFPEGRVGRAPNGNAVLSGVKVEAISIADASQREEVSLGWAWANIEQANGDFRVVNVLNTADDLGWAVDAHRVPGNRLALLLADEPFGFEGGTELRVTLQYQSVYAQHTFGRVRLSVGTIAEAAFAQLPAAVSGWYLVGPFPIQDREKAYEAAFGPESDATLDLTRNFGAGNQFWRFNEAYLDDRVNALAEGMNVSYVGRRVFSPTARSVTVSLGSDDGFGLYVNGKEVLAKQADRSVAPDQDRATVELVRGVNTIVLKVVNTNGLGGYYYRAERRDEELSGPLAGALLPPAAHSAEMQQSLEQEWKIHFSPGYRERRDELAGLERKREELEASLPRTMVMKELPEPRPTFVLTRGLYDKPDMDKPVTRGIPAALGHLPAEAPPNRLGLAQWMTSAENPLVARVAVNRLWEMLFGAGLVGSSEDFGLQGEWPSHPELLDWLAVEFRESGWDVQHMLRLMVTSRTYRQAARIRPEAVQRDPDNRLLAYFPRRRLSAEQLRDQALYVSGLLVEHLGGPSVKPYQPDGLWPEVSMPQSNTREYARSTGAGLWRRSLYTYWKRACPPPSLMNLDAPTREACVVRRITTNTPLQALTLWNDEQFVEAARALAQRVLLEPGADDGARLSAMYRRCTGRAAGADELARMAEALAAFRARYAAAPDDAEKLLKIGEAPMSAAAKPGELAAWTMLANALLNLSATITQS